MKLQILTDSIERNIKGIYISLFFPCQPKIIVITNKSPKQETKLNWASNPHDEISSDSESSALSTVPKGEADRMSGVFNISITTMTTM